MSELKAFSSERIYWAVEQVERVAGDIDRLHLDDNWFHLKSEVDTAITELKARIHELESIPHTDNSAVIERLSNENERLKAKLESVQATAYAESVDAGMRERKLKRALWLARAMRADDAAHWTVYVTYMHYHENSFYAFDGDDVFHRNNKNLDGFKLWCSKWETVKVKCLKKAEEYR